MPRIKGNVQLPENMYNLLNVMESRKEERKTAGNEFPGYLIKFDQYVYPIIISIFYGLYKSQELPPLDMKDIKLAKTRDLSVEITSYSKIFTHYLFCLWVKTNGLPSINDSHEYRNKLYSFLEKVLNDDFFQDVVIPFYLTKADEESKDTSSFLHRLWRSDNAGLEPNDFTPEWMAVEFRDAQDDFIKNVVKPLSETL